MRTFEQDLLHQSKRLRGSARMQGEGQREGEAGIVRRQLLRLLQMAERLVAALLAHQAEAQRVVQQRGLRT
ncbi:hypothetical protein D3C80_2063040 [compost metagenome]